jgi:hypothetical protein
VPPALRFLVGLAVFAAVVRASSRVGVPHDATAHEDLPDIALGWRLLFHVLRASALLGAVGVVGLVAWRGSHGEWPARVGQVEYAPKDTAAVTVDMFEAASQRLTFVEAELKQTQLRLDEQSGKD